MKIAVDAMGGDYAPEEIVRGAVIGADEYKVGIILVGPQQIIEQELAKHKSVNPAIEIVHTDEYLVEGEPPALALRKKRNASIVVATGLVKAGKADAVVSAGPTGGVVATALSILGTIEGISRPVVGGAFIGFAPNTVVMDCGGNVDCQPYQLLDFAVVGSVYAQKYLNIQNPTVALLSIGAEEGKGNDLVKQSYPLFKKCGLNFIGNVEGSDVPYDRANVVICDGFVGNVIVKLCESIGKIVCQQFEDRFKGKLPEADIKEFTDYLLSATNAADAKGGGALLAVNGIACVAHGRSKHDVIARLIGQAKLSVEADIVNSLKTELAAARKRFQEPSC